jgi:CRP/FNR family transcriptional regulator, dissimilatory nitrate respiration regulator
MKNTEDIAAQLAQCAFFRTLSGEDLAPFVDAARPLTLASGQALFRSGEPAHAFFILLSGHLRLYRLTSEGKEKIIEIIEPGQSFGEAVAFLDKPFPVFATAIDACTVLSLPSALLRAQVAQNQGLALRMLAGLSTRVHQFVQDIHALSLSSAQQRVAGYLLAFLDDGAGAQTLQLPATKAMVASRLGLQPETFSRVLTRLREQGIVAEGRDGITVLSPAALRRFQETA